MFFHKKNRLKATKTKEIIYLFSFSLLGFLLSFLIHAFIDITVINLLVKDFSVFGLGMTWPQWFVIHDIFTVVLALAGIIFGFWQGRYWWQILYIEHKYCKN